MSKALRLPAASMTARISCAVASTVGRAPTRSESPMPRRSKRIRRPRRETAVIQERQLLSSQTRSTCEMNPGTSTMSDRAAAGGLERNMDAVHLDIARSGHVHAGIARWLTQQGKRGGVRRYAEFLRNSKRHRSRPGARLPPCPRRPDGRGSDDGASFRSKGPVPARRVACTTALRGITAGDLGFDEPLQRLHQPAAQSLAPEEGPFLEFRTVRQ